MDFKEVRNNVINKVSEKSPEILVGIGLAGMLTSTVLAVKATPKALDILAQEEEELTTVRKLKRLGNAIFQQPLDIVHQRLVLLQQLQLKINVVRC